MSWQNMNIYLTHYEVSSSAMKAAKLLRFFFYLVFLMIAFMANKSRDSESLTT